MLNPWVNVETSGHIESGLLYFHFLDKGLDKRNKNCGFELGSESVSMNTNPIRKLAKS